MIILTIKSDRQVLWNVEAASIVRLIYSHFNIILVNKPLGFVILAGKRNKHPWVTKNFLKD